MQKIKLIFISLILLLSSCTNEYFIYHSQNQEYLENKTIIEQNLDKYDLKNIEQRDVEIISFPSKTGLDKIINLIDKAQKRVYLEVYILTEKRIISALKNAKNRGVDIRIILEKNVFGSPTINKKSFQELEKVGINIKYASETNYNFTHSKFFIIDDFFIIGTGNMSHSTFTVNKEFFVVSNNKKDLLKLEQIFEDDFNYKKSIICGLNLISSPDCSRETLSNLIKSAKSTIYIYNQEISDDEILDILKEKKREGLDIKLIIGDKNKVKKNNQIMLDLKKLGIEVISPKKPYTHAKLVLIDGSYIYVGSVNFTTNSFDNNKEVGVIFNNAKTGQELKKEFLKDFLNLQ